MLNNDNIISTILSEAVGMIPIDEKDYGKSYFMCFPLHIYGIQRADQDIAKNRNSCLHTRIHPVLLKRHFT